MTLAVVAPRRRFVDTPEDAQLRQYVIAAAEARLGRKLHPSELNMDHLAIDRALEVGKKRLHGAIEMEKRRVIKSQVARHPVSRIHLAVTPEMTAALLSLHAEGKRQALAELEALGVTPRRQYADTPPSLDNLMASLMGKLGPIGLRVQTEHAGVAAQIAAGNIGDMSRATMAREIDRLVPGALDASSRLVSGAFDAGRGDIFSLNSDLIGEWLYTAVMDGATCDVCASYDGVVFESWEAIQEVLPGGGPNPECDGNGRCRCMAAPYSSAGPGVGAQGFDDLFGPGGAREP